MVFNLLLPFVTRDEEHPPKNHLELNMGTQARHPSQIVGFTALGLFVWVLTDPSLVISMAQERNHFYIGLYVFLIVGLLMLVVAILGCCGSLKESPCMLIGVSECGYEVWKH